MPRPAKSRILRVLRLVLFRAASKGLGGETFLGVVACAMLNCEIAAFSVFCEMVFCPFSAQLPSAELVLVSVFGSESEREKKERGCLVHGSVHICVRSSVLLF
jgi:hypothetical protein